MDPSKQPSYQSITSSSQRYNLPPPVYHPVQSQYPIQHAVVPTNRKSPARRFLHAVAGAIIVWILWSLFMDSFIEAARRTYDGIRYGYDRWDDYPIPEGVDLKECAIGDDWLDLDRLASPREEFIPSGWPHAAQTEFSLPLTSDVLFLLSKGSLSGGSVDVVTSSEAAQDAATVRVVAHFHRRYILDRAKVCLIDRGEGENGVGIFTSRWINNPRRDERLYFQTTITLPEVASHLPPLLLKKFQTDVSNTLHRIDDLENKVLFQSIDLKGSNGPIEAKSLSAEKGDIKTSNSPISGVFNTTGTLILQTSNSPITVDVGLLKKDDTSPTVQVKTSNGALKADFSLLSSSDIGGTYEISAETSNSPLKVHFPTAPVDSVLKFTGYTSNSPATVSLHPTYEGSFQLRTSLFSPTLHRYPNEEDPSGRGRKRVMEGHTSRGVSEGTIRWEGSDDVDGVVHLRTSNSQVVLEY